MKLILVAFGCVAVLALSGCVATNQQSRVDRDGSGASTHEHGLATRLETVKYDWKNYGITVSLYERESDSRWEMSVRDAQDVVVQATAERQAKVWAISECKCSTEEFIWIMNRSLTDFHKEKPEARLESVNIEMQLIRDLWGEILAGLNRRLSSLDGTKDMGLFDVPPEIEDEVRQVLNKSHTVATIRDLLQKNGMNVRGIYLGEQVMFKDTLSGQKWSEIANLPGIGVLDPGVVEFNLGESGTELDSIIGSTNSRRNAGCGKL